MKIRIAYKYEKGVTYPFRALTVIDNNFVMGISKESFSEAKEDLIKTVEQSIERVPTIIPETEEVEIQ